MALSILLKKECAFTGKSHSVLAAGLANLGHQLPGFLFLELPIKVEIDMAGLFGTSENKCVSGDKHQVLILVYHIQPNLLDDIGNQIHGSR